MLAIGRIQDKISMGTDLTTLSAALGASAASTASAAHTYFT
jgi:hypothetical protein